MNKVLSVSGFCTGRSAKIKVLSRNIEKETAETLVMQRIDIVGKKILRKADLMRLQSNVLSNDRHVGVYVWCLPADLEKAIENVTSALNTDITAALENATAMASTFKDSLMIDRSEVDSE